MTIKPLQPQNIVSLCQQKAILVVQEHFKIGNILQSLSLKKFVSWQEISHLSFYQINTFPNENWKPSSPVTEPEKTKGCWESNGKIVQLFYDQTRLLVGRISQKEKLVPSTHIYTQWNQNYSQTVPHLLTGQDDLYFFEPGTSQEKIIYVKFQQNIWKKEDSISIKNALQTLLQESRSITHLDFQGAAALDQCCNAVCRIVKNEAQNGKEDLWGTGFVIGNRLLMTNHHVLDSPEKCSKSHAEFFLEKQKKKVTVKFKPADLFITSQSPSTGPDGLNIDNLDFTIVAIEDDPDLREIFTYPICLNEYENPEEEGFINLIHHPNGKKKDIRSAKYLGHRISKVHQFYVTYRADTAPGSSGSPVFDSSWHLIGLHRQTEGKNPASDKVAIKAANIYCYLFKNGFLKKIQQPSFQPLEEATNAKKMLHLLKQIYREGAVIRRFSGKSLPLETHYINLQIVKEEEQKNKEAKLGQSPENKKDREAESLSYHHNHLPTYEEIFAPKEPIAIDQLFDPQKGETSEMRLRRLVLGKAGIGKSTFCQHAAYQWAQGKLWNDHFDWVFLIPLRELNDHPYKTNLKKFIYEKWFSSKKEGDFEDFWDKEIASSRKVLFLIDGYDELSSSVNFTNLLKPYVSASILMTSRPYELRELKDYEQRLEIIGFTDENIKHFIGHCFNDVNSSPAKNSAIPKMTTAVFTHTNSTDNKSQLKESLLECLDQNPAIKGIAHIPIQLDLMCTIWEDQKLEMGSSISMTTLYHQLEIYLLRRHFNLIESTADSIVEDQGEPLIHFLSNLAFFAMKKESLIIRMDLIDEAERLATKKNSEGYLKDALGMGVLKKIEGKQEYYFVHLTFQEYYAARYLVFHLRDSSEKVEVFIRTEKHNRRMQIVFWFAAGLSCLEDKPGGSSSTTSSSMSLTNQLFKLILEEPQDILGIYDVQLGIRLLEEAELPKTDVVNPLYEKVDRWLVPKDVQFHLTPLHFLVDSFKQSPCYIQERFFSEYLELLKNGSKEDKIKICMMLERLQIANENIIEELVTLSRDKDVKWKAISALKNIIIFPHQNNLVEKFKKILSSKEFENIDVKMMAIHILRKLKALDVKNVVENLLDSATSVKDLDEKKILIAALKKLEIPPTQVMHVVKNLLNLAEKEKDKDVVKNVINTIGELKIPDDQVPFVLEEFYRIASGKEKDIKNEVISTVSKLKILDTLVLSIVQEFRKLVNSSDEVVDAISKLKIPDNLFKDVLELIVNLEDSPQNKAWTGAQVVEKLKIPDNLFNEVVEWLFNLAKESKQTYCITKAINTVGELKIPDDQVKGVIKSLLELTNSPEKRLSREERDIQKEAITALSNLKISNLQVMYVIGGFLELASSPDEALNAVSKLEIPDDQFVDVLEGLLELGESDEQKAIIFFKAVSKLKIPEDQIQHVLINILMLAKEANTRIVKKEAIDALGKLKIPYDKVEYVVQELLSLADQDIEIKVIIDALSRLKIPNDFIKKVLGLVCKLGSQFESIQDTIFAILGNLEIPDIRVKGMLNIVIKNQLKITHNFLSNLSSPQHQDGMSSCIFKYVLEKSNPQDVVNNFIKEHLGLVDFLELYFKHKVFEEKCLNIIIKFACKEQSTLCFYQGSLYLHHRRGMQMFSDQDGSLSLNQLETGLKKLGNDFMKDFENTADITPSTPTTSSKMTSNQSQEECLIS